MSFTKVFDSPEGSTLPRALGAATPGTIGLAAPLGAQVSRLTLMVGNFALKSLAFCATLTATVRATAL